MGTTVMPVYSNADLVFNTRLEKIPLFTTTPIIGAGTSNQGVLHLTTNNSNETPFNLRYRWGMPS